RDVSTLSTGTPEFDWVDQGVDASTDPHSQREVSLESSHRTWYSAQSGLHRNGLYWSLSRGQSACSAISPATGWARSWRSCGHRATRVGGGGSDSSHRHARTI